MPGFPNPDPAASVSSPSSAQTAPRIALIHALAHSIAPINQAFDEIWPQASRMNLLDDSLSRDLAATGRGLDAAMFARFKQLAGYAVDTGAQGILFTCSAFGPCIEAVAQAMPGIPVLKPNEAMIDEVAACADGPVGLIATFAPALQSLPPEFPASVTLELALAEGALAALDRGDLHEHDARIVDAARQLQARGCQRLALGQFSAARAQALCAQATGLPVHTTVHSAVLALRQRIAALARS